MVVLTTEKDAVRLAACDLGELPIASVPLVVGVEPADAFRAWLTERITVSRQLSVVSRRSLVVGRQSSVVGRQSSVVSRRS
jgi:hypothetical protein